MPALTVRAISKALSDYVRSDQDIVAKLNLVGPRLYAMGYWRDLVYEWQVETTNDYVTLPEQAEALMAGMIDNAPSGVQSRWHDYRVGGYARSGPSPLFGLVDDGWRPTKERLPVSSAADVYEIEIRPVDPNSVLPDEGSITLLYSRDTDADGVKDTDVVAEFVLDGSADMTSAHADIRYIESILHDDVPAEVDVVAVNQDDSSEYVLARVRGDGVARYRHYRFSNPNAETIDIKMLLKRAWIPVIDDTDVIYLGNLSALKHGLLGMLAEDNADLERAQYHWTICRQLLDEELDMARSAAKPKLFIDPSGTGSLIHNML